MEFAILGGAALVAYLILKSGGPGSPLGAIGFNSNEPLGAPPELPPPGGAGQGGGNVGAAGGTGGTGFRPPATNGSVYSNGPGLTTRFGEEGRF